VSPKRAALLVLVGAALGSALTALLIAALDDGDRDDDGDGESAGTAEGDAATDRQSGERSPARKRDLRGDCALAGTVENLEGDPIEGAWIGVRLLDEPWATADLDLEIRTDANGRFAVEGLTRDARYHIWAWAPGFQAAGYEDARCGAMSDFALEPGASLSIGFADSRDEPVGPVRVVVAGSELWPPRSTVTGPDSRIELRGLAPGYYLVWGEAGDGAQITDGPIEVEAGQRYELSLTLDPAKPTAVEVLDLASGKPIAGASVLYGPASTSLLYRVAITDRDGLANAAGLPPGEHSVSVVAPGYVTSDAKPLQPGGEITVKLQRGAVVSGTVLTLDGGPVSEARVFVEQDLGAAAVSLHEGQQRRFLDRMVTAAGKGWPSTYAIDEGSATPGPTRLPVPSLSGESDELIGGGSWRPTDEDGGFRIDGLPGGRILLGASHPRYVLADAAAVTLESGGNASGVVIRMKPGCTVSVRTLDERGYPIRDSEVKAYDEHGDTLREATSGTDGFAELIGLPNRFDIVATAEGRAPALAKMRAKPGKHLTIEITLPTADKQIHGRVVDERGYGVEQVTITAKAATRGLSHVLTTTTADDGTFVLENAGSGAYRVTAEVNGRVKAQVMNASHYEGLKLVITGSGGPGFGQDDLGYVTPEMLASSIGSPAPDNLGVTGGYDLSGQVGDEDPGIIAITETEERGDSLMTEYGMADALPVTGPPRGKGGLPVKLGGGPGKVIVKSVQPGSRVANAGLSVGDRIVAVDGVKVGSPAQARNAIAGPIGSVVMLEVVHDGERVNVVVQRVRVSAQ
jgi:hypothetical protein